MNNLMKIYEKTIVCKFFRTVYEYIKKTQLIILIDHRIYPVKIYEIIVHL